MVEDTADTCDHENEDIEPDNLHLEGYERSLWRMRSSVAGMKQSAERGYVVLTIS